MSSFIYILTDGTNTKIGKTISFDKRMSSYNTHNANVQLVKKYPCSEDEATRVETFIKNLFKEQLVGKGREWFAVSSGEIDRYVSNLLFKPTTSDIKPANHGVKLTEEAFKLKEEIISGFTGNGRNEKDIDKARDLRNAYYSYLDTNNDTYAKEAKKQYEVVSNKISKAYYDSITSKKEQLATLFATKFQLGIPEHKLPVDDIQIKDGMGVDLKHCDMESSLVFKSVKNTRVEMPFSDHCYRFFHLYKLPTGYYVAFCSAIVSMPYIEELKEENQEKIFDTAKQVGWYSTIHNDWSWHSPDKTGLVLYQPKTSISHKVELFEKSFRRWVIENQVVLQQEKFGDKEWLKKVIEDIAYDNGFPLDVGSFEELCDKYLYIFWYISAVDDEELGIDWQVRAFRFLFEKWQENLTEN